MTIEHLKPKTQNPRRGVTLMEVLFAIGIILMGLLGIAALIPVAGHYAARGLRLDHASAVGRNAFREFETRGMANRENWLVWNQVANAYRSPESPKQQGGIDLANRPGVSVCIDPRFKAFHDQSGASNSRTFPYGDFEDGERPYMYRISLRSGPESLMAMTRNQADNIFMSRDDLSIIVPDHDRTLRPVRQMGTTPDGMPTRSQFEGRMSWFATLVPKMNTHLAFADSGIERRQHVLSIVVLHRRDAGFTIEGNLSPDERMVNVNQMLGFLGGGGGDVLLTADSPEMLELQEGDWVMLGRRVPSAGGGQTPYFRWYRVAMTDSEDGSTERWATLIGPDWDVSEPTHAVLVTGVVGVYEKTVNLERSSLWN